MLNMNQMLAHQTCWLPDPAASLYSPHSSSDQSASFSGGSAQPSPAVAKPMEASFAGAFGAGMQQHQQLASFMQSALGGGGFTSTGMERMMNATSGRPTKRKPMKVPEEKKDEAYKQRRNKNNDSAKRSRELRRRKEEETQQRNAELEQENQRLRQQIYYLQFELLQLQQKNNWYMIQPENKPPGCQMPAMPMPVLHPPKG